MQLNAVVLPAPFGPIRPTISNSFTSRLTSCSACRPPKRMDRSCTSSTDMGALHRSRSAVRVVVHREPRALEPALDRGNALADPAWVEDERLQQQHRADEAGEGTLVGPVVAVQDRHVLDEVPEAVPGDEQLVEQVVEER